MVGTTEVTERGMVFTTENCPILPDWLVATMVIHHPSYRNRAGNVASIHQWMLDRGLPDTTCHHMLWRMSRSTTPADERVEVIADHDKVFILRQSEGGYEWKLCYGEVPVHYLSGACLRIFLTNYPMPTSIIGISLSWALWRGASFIFNPLLVAILALITLGLFTLWWYAVIADEWWVIPLICTSIMLLPSRHAMRGRRSLVREFNAERTEKRTLAWRWSKDNLPTDWSAFTQP